MILYERSSRLLTARASDTEVCAIEKRLSEELYKIERWMSQTLNLGVEFDDRLSWSSHVRQMIFKESKYIGILGSQQ